MLTRKKFGFSHLILLGVLGVLQGCADVYDGTDPEPINTPAEANDSSLDDITTYTQLYGSVSPFERVTIITPFDTSSIRIDFRNIETEVTYSQIAVRNSSGNYNFLVLPISQDTTEFIEVSSDNVVFGEISILPLSPSEPEYVPGQFALDAMNSILMGLRNKIDDLQNADQDVETMGSNFSTGTILALDNSVNQFQSHVALMDDATVFNSPITSPESGETLLDRDSLIIIDSIYLKLLDNIDQTSLFLDGDFDSSPSVDATTRLSFEQINVAARSRFADQDGINALASLSMYSTDAPPQSTIKQFSDAISLVSASLVPAIVTNFLSLSDATQSRTYLSEAMETLSNAQTNSGFEYNYFYTKAIETLKTLEAQISL